MSSEGEETRADSVIRSEITLTEDNLREAIQLWVRANTDATPTDRITIEAPAEPDPPWAPRGEFGARIVVEQRRKSKHDEESS